MKYEGKDEIPRNGNGWNTKKLGKRTSKIGWNTKERMEDQGMEDQGKDGKQGKDLNTKEWTDYQGKDGIPRNGGHTKKWGTTLINGERTLQHGEKYQEC